MEKYCTAGQVTDDNMIQLMRMIPKATNTHSAYVILIPLLLHQWLHEGASVLGYTCLACIVPINMSRVST